MNTEIPGAAHIDTQLIASVLAEALPYIQRYHGKTVVLKYGGNAMVDTALKNSFARDIVLLKLVGVNPVVVHGGGPQISATLKRLGKESEFVQGLRVTDSDTMDIVEMVLGGLVNKEIVSLINGHGGRAAGLSGKDGGLIRAAKLTLPGGDGADAIDIGHVGDVKRIDPRLVSVIQEREFIPVIAPIGVGDDGLTYNINADTVAGKLAITLGADRLILMTNTAGVLDADGALMTPLKSESVTSLINDGTISGGMIPKMHCALDAVAGGVNAAVVCDGRVPHAILLELLTNRGVGSIVTA